MSDSLHSEFGRSQLARRASLLFSFVGEGAQNLAWLADLPIADSLRKPGGEGQENV